MPAETTFMDNLVALCKRRGFIFQSSEIYGGIGGFWDYGPLGVELKRNIKNAWWHDYVTNPPTGPDGREIEMVGLDCSIIMNPKVWEASGHATGFVDPMVDCLECRRRYRADKVWTIQLFNPECFGDGGAFESMTAAGHVGSLGGTYDSTKGSILALAAIEADGPEDVLESLDEAVRRGARARNIPWLKKGIRIEHRAMSAAVLNIVAKTDANNTQYMLVRPIDHALFPGFGERICPNCPGQLTESRSFNLMFKTHVGALQDASSQAWLRPETAQGIFANYKNVLDTSRVKVPFGIAQVGKAFRNEINPRNYTFRSREFEQMEIEFFCKADEDCRPGELSAMDWYQFWRNERFNWYVRHGLKSEKLRLRDQGKEELAHYSKACADIEYLFPFSDEFQELEGCAHRGCFDLTQHQTHSGKDLTYFDDEAWDRDKDRFSDKDAAAKAKSVPPYRYLPTVIEPSAGADRATLAFLCEAYREDKKPDAKGELQTRVYMSFHPRLAPIKAAFLPLVNKEGMPEIAEAIYRDAKKHMNAFLDVKGAIGRRYYRQDEAGTPYGITVDGETLKDGTVTIRDRDTLQQVRVPKDAVVAWLRERLGE